MLVTTYGRHVVCRKLAYIDSNEKNELVGELVGANDWAWVANVGGDGGEAAVRGGGTADSADSSVRTGPAMWCRRPAPTAARRRGCGRSTMPKSAAALELGLREPGFTAIRRPITETKVRMLEHLSTG